MGVGLKHMFLRAKQSLSMKLREKKIIQNSLIRKHLRTLGPVTSQMRTFFESCFQIWNQLVEIYQLALKKSKNNSFIFLCVLKFSFSKLLLIL